jgi:Zn-dependent M28 family amino/carboxypeptidase
MFRFAGLTLLALSTSVFAQTGAAPSQSPPAQPQPQPAAAAAQAPAPAATPAPPAHTLLTQAQRNALLAAPLPADQAAMKAHVVFLASDALRGREAGTHDFDVAAQYVAAQFYAAGLRPAGDEGGYLQKVPLLGYKLADKGTATWTPTKGSAQSLVFGEDYVPSPNAAAAKTAVDAPVVFVGYGITAPQIGYDDYKGVDVRGKIVAFVNGAPDGLQSEERAVLGQAAGKTAIAMTKGAVGAIVVGTRAPTPQMAAMAGRAIEAERVTWARPDGTGSTPSPSVPVLANLTPAGAAKLFGPAWAGIAAAADIKPGELKRAGFKPVTAQGRLAINSATTFRPLPSSNVVGIVPGADPKLKDEVVVLSAHLDHIGVTPERPGQPAGGDRINNGAFDNAIGIASLIEEAKRFTTSGQAPRRTVMFLAVTAEEKGLVGADYFANNPTVPLKNIVADVNLDMPVLLYKFEDMVVFGAERSTLGPIVRRAVNAAGVDLSPDPSPEQSFFTRSDHFRFVQKGVPSVFLWPGQKGDGGAFQRFLTTCYHRPCDEPTQPILWDQGVRFVDVNYRIAREIADGEQRPVWNKGDYFGTLFKGPMAK